jgi:hypothetical protein
MMTWRPPSISELSVWDRRLAAQRGDEAVHEALGREVEHLAVGLGVAAPGDRLQEMRLSQAHAGVDVERIEHHRIAAARDRHLLGGGVRQRVGAADHERVEGQPWVERRAAVRLLARRGRNCEAARLRAVALAMLLAWLCVGRIGADHRRAHQDVDATQRRQLGLPAQQDLLAVVRLHPGLEEACRDRQPDRLAIDAFQVHALEPAGEDVLADFRAQALLHAQPALLVRTMILPRVRVRLGGVPV